MEQTRRRRTLGRQEIFDLIKVWQAYYTQLVTSNRNAHVYTKICRELARKHAIRLSLEELKNRIHNLTKRYRSEKLIMCKNGGLAPDWVYFEAIDGFMSLQSGTDDFNCSSGFETNQIKHNDDGFENCFGLNIVKVESYTDNSFLDWPTASPLQILPHSDVSHSPPAENIAEFCTQQLSCGEIFEQQQPENHVSYEPNGMLLSILSSPSNPNAKVEILDTSAEKIKAKIIEKYALKRKCQKSAQQQKTQPKCKIHELGKYMQQSLKNEEKIISLMQTNNELLKVLISKTKQQ